MKKKKVAIPPEFLCPISGLIMADPVSTVDGHTYERDFIEEWLVAKNKNTSPATNLELPSKTLTSVIVFKKMIVEFLDKHPELVDEGHVYTPKATAGRFCELVKKDLDQEAINMMNSDYRVLLSNFQHRRRGLLPVFAYLCEIARSKVMLAAFDLLVAKKALGQVLEVVRPHDWVPLALIRVLAKEIKSGGARVEDLRALALQGERYNEWLVRCCRAGKTLTMQALLKLGADPNYQEGAPLIAAIEGRRAEVCKVLLKAGAQVKVTPAGETALHRAAKAFFAKGFVLLVKFGYDPNAQFQLGNGPMVSALEFAKLGMQRELIDQFCQSYVDMRNDLNKLQKECKTLKQQLQQREQQQEEAAEAPPKRPRRATAAKK